MYRVDSPAVVTVSTAANPAIPSAYALPLHVIRNELFRAAGVLGSADDGVCGGIPGNGVELAGLEIAMQGEPVPSIGPRAGLSIDAPIAPPGTARRGPRPCRPPESAWGELLGGRVTVGQGCGLGFPTFEASTRKIRPGGHSRHPIEFGQGGMVGWLPADTLGEARLAITGDVGEVGVGVGRERAR